MLSLLVYFLQLTIHRIHGSGSLSCWLWYHANDLYRASAASINLNRSPAARA